MNKLRILLMAMMLMGLSAQAQFKVEGVVTDTVGEGEAYATVRIYEVNNKEKAVKLGVTDIDGKFGEDLKAPGKYVLTVTSVGKMPIEKQFELTQQEKVKNLGKMVMSNNATALAAVEVIAQKPLVTTKIDRLDYDVQADEDSKVLTTLDMLKKVPMVTVDGQENIKVKGSGNFKIYKNGRPDNTMSGNPKDVLRAIPASMIKRIEVITEPGAKYDAEGVNGILNIVMMEGSMVKGVMGNIGGETNTQGLINGNAFLITQVGKFTTSLNYGCTSLSKKMTRQNSEVNNTYVQTGNKYESKSSSVSPGLIHYGNIETSYEIDTLNLVSMSFGGYFYKLDVDVTRHESMTTATGEPIYSFDCRYNSPKYQYFDFNGKLDYQHLTKRKGESFVWSYLLSTTNQTKIEHTEYSKTENFPINYTVMDANGKLNFVEHTAQFDWTRPLAMGHAIEAGAKYIYRNNDSKTIYEYNNGENAPTNFNHLTQVAAVYGEYRYDAMKWGARAGVRYEYSYLSAKYKDRPEDNYHSSLNDVVPTVSVRYVINQSNNLKLNFATRINRPGIAYLNPAVNKTPREIAYGNPNLKSSRNNSLSLGYSLIKPKITINSSLNYNFADNDIAYQQTVKDNVIYTTYENTGKIHSFEIQTYAQWQIGAKTSWMMNGSIGYNKFENQNLGLQLGKWGGNLYTNVTQVLPFNVRLSVFGGVYGGRVSNVYSWSGVNGFYGVSLSKSFLKEDRLTVRLNAQDMFNANGNWTSHKVNGDVIGTTISSQVRRMFGIGISYRFGKLNAQVKKVNATIENDDLKGRK